LVQTRTDIVDEGSRLSAEFRDVLASDRTEASAAARRDLASLVASSAVELRKESVALQAQLAQSTSAAGDRAIEEYKKRLEATSNSWLLTTASRLDQQSREMIQSIAESAQAQLREACFQVFAEVSDNLRQRAIETSAQPNAKSVAASG
jgi:hypothetical protein